MSNMCAVLFLFVILVSEIAGTDQMKSENPNSKQFMNQDFGQYLLNSTESVDIFFALTPTNAEENIVKSPDPKIDWKTTRDGVKWFPNCGFPGYDIKNEYVGGKCNHCKCSELCIDTSGCNKLDRRMVLSEEYSSSST